MANTIAKMREATWNGVIDQNGSNDHFYRVYDKDGRIAGSKEGIVTVPAELTPRQAHVDKSKSIEKDYQPQTLDAQVLPKKFIEVEGKEIGETVQVNGQAWRATPIKGAQSDFMDAAAGNGGAKPPTPPTPPVTTDPDDEEDE